MTAPVGLSGSQTQCKIPPKRWRLGLSTGYLDTTMRLGGVDMDFIEYASGISIRRELPARFGLALSVSASMGGEIDAPGPDRYDLRPGIAAALITTFQVLRPNRAKLFLVLGFASAGAVRTTQEPRSGQTERLWTTDFRGSVTFGRSFRDMFNPYLAVRAYGGPVRWIRDGVQVKGKDPNHHALALGSVFVFPRGFDLTVDWAFEGGRGFSVSGGWSF